MTGLYSWLTCGLSLDFISLYLLSSHLSFHTCGWAQGGWLCRDRALLVYLEWGSCVVMLSSMSPAPVGVLCWLVLCVVLLMVLRWPCDSHLGDVMLILCDSHLEDVSSSQFFPRATRGSHSQRCLNLIEQG
jgi:hypothetical protein